MTWKKVQDRYKFLQSDFDKKNKRKHIAYGIGGGEKNEMEEFLADVIQEGEDTFIEKTSYWANKNEEQEEKKTRIGDKLVLESLERNRGWGNNDENDVKDDYDYSNKMEGSKKRRRKFNWTSLKNKRLETDLFGAQLKESELTRVEFHKKRLEFEKAKFE